MHNAPMRLPGVVVALVGLVALFAHFEVANAKPLPAGLEVKLVKGTVKASRDGVSVPIGAASKLLGVELSADGKDIVIKVPGNPEMGEDPETTETFALAKVEAKLGNAKGMSFQVKKKYADAVAPFTNAVQLDPQPVYITNLLSALSMGKKLDDADKVIAQHGKRIAPWLAWRLAVDKELASLVDRASTKALFPGGGKATSKLGSWDKEKVAYSKAGFAAVEVYTNLMMGDPYESSQALAIVNLATGEEVLRLSTETSCAPDSGCKQSKYNAANKKNRAIADKVMQQMGFEIAGDLANYDAENPTSKDGRKIVDVKDGGKAIAAGKSQIPLPDDLEIKQAGFVPKALVLVHKVQTSSNEDGMGTWEMEVTAVPTP